MIPKIHAVYIFLLSLLQTGIENYNVHMDCITSYAKVETHCSKRNTVGVLSKEDRFSVCSGNHIN